jgi:Na+-transporting methylmalonyl-CoA/oxaloacetate decarboxylase gamma subunit
LELYDGFRLMGIGMATVIGFLCLLVLLMQTSTLFFRHYHRRFPPAGSTTPDPRAPSNQGVAIALAAVVHHKNKHRGA